MSNDLYFEGKRYISSRRAAEDYGYTRDYIGQLIRGKKVDAKMIGRSWFVSIESLDSYQHSFSASPRVSNLFVSSSRDSHAKARTSSTISSNIQESPFLPQLKKVKLAAKSGYVRKNHALSPRLAYIGDKAVAAVLSLGLIVGTYYAGDVESVRAAYRFSQSIGEKIARSIEGGYVGFIAAAETVGDTYIRAIDNGGSALLTTVGSASAILDAGNAVVDSYVDSVELVKEGYLGAINSVAGLATSFGGDNNKASGVETVAFADATPSKTSSVSISSASVVLTKASGSFALIFDRASQASSAAFEKTYNGFKDAAEIFSDSYIYALNEAGSRLASGISFMARSGEAIARGYEAGVYAISDSYISLIRGAGAELHSGGAAVASSLREASRLARTFFEADPETVVAAASQVNEDRSYIRAIARGIADSYSRALDSAGDAYLALIDGAGTELSGAFEDNGFNSLESAAISVYRTIDPIFEKTGAFIAGLFKSGATIAVEDADAPSVADNIKPVVIASVPTTTVIARTVPNGRTAPQVQSVYNTFTGLSAGEVDLKISSVKVSLEQEIQKALATAKLSISNTRRSTDTISRSSASESTITGSTLAGTTIVSGTLRLSTLDCTSSGNGGTLTTDSSGNIVCAADDNDGASSFSSTSASYFDSQFRSWAIQSGSYLAPTTTLGVIVNASSTIGSGTAAGGLTVNGTATTTNLTISGISGSTQCLRVNSLGQVSGTGADCGSGSGASANSKWATSTLDTSAIYTVGASGNSSVGIGTSTPAWSLQIASSTPYLAITDTNAPTNRKHWLISNNDGIFRIGTSSDALSATSTYFTINQTGNVGIGNSNPTNKLDVTGSAVITGTIDAPTHSAGNFVLNQSNGITFVDTATAQLTVGSATALSARPWRISSGDATKLDGYIAFETGGAERMRFTAFNLGIGTTTPNWSLQIASSTPYFAISDTSAGTNFKHWLLSNIDGDFIIGTSSDALNATSSRLKLDKNGALTISGLNCSSNSNGGALTADANGLVTCTDDDSGGASGGGNSKWATSTLDTSAIYTVGASGNSSVGIGTSTPAWSLQIASSTPYLAITDTNATLDNKHWLISNNDGAFRIGTSSDALNSTSTLLTINTVGNVGIGTSSPYAKLSVNINAGEPPRDIFAVGSSTASATTTHFRIANNGRIAIGARDLTSGYTVEVSGGITTTSNVRTESGSFIAGLYTIDGSEGFSLSGGLASIKVTTATPLGVRPWRIISGDSTGTDGYAAFEMAGGEVARFNKYGLGIGTTTPNWSLQVASTTPYIAITDTNAPTDGKHWLISNSDGIFRIGTSTDALNSTTTALSIGSTRNVAINAQPNSFSELEVNGRITITTGNALAFAASGGNGSARITGSGLNGGNDFIGFQTAFTEKARFDNAGNFGIGSTTPWALLSVNPDGIAGPSFAIGSSTKTDFIVTNAGNVGIGTSSPYAKLSIVGEAVARNFSATSTSATSTFAGGLNVGNGSLVYDFSSGVTSISSLELGAFNFDTNAGVVSWVDLPVTSSATVGTVESYSAQIDSNPILTVYAESDGAGSIRKTAVGVGTTTPNWVLQIASTSPSFAITDTNAPTNGKHWLFTNLDGRLNIGTSSDALSATSSSLTIDQGGNVAVGTTSPFGTGLLTVGTSSPNFYVDRLSGNVGIGTTTPQQKLHVVRATDGAPIRFEDSNGYCEIDPTTTTWTCTSDISLKKDISSIATAETLQRMAQLQAVSFRWKTQDTDDLRYGFIAQDVEKLFPELVSTSVTGIKSVAYGGFTPFIIEAIKALNLSIKDLEVRVDSIEGRLAALESYAEMNGFGTTSTSSAASATSTASSTIDTVSSWLASLGTVIENAVSRFVSVIADAVTTKKLRVGDEANLAASGITILDRATGQPYCIFVSNGSMQTQAGECAPVAETSTQPPVVEETQAPAATSTPSETVSAPETATTTPAETEPSSETVPVAEEAPSEAALTPEEAPSVSDPAPEAPSEPVATESSSETP